MTSPGIGPGALWAGLANLPMDVQRFKEHEEDRATTQEEIQRRRQAEDLRSGRENEAWANYQSEQSAKQAASEMEFDYSIGPDNPVKDFWGHSQTWGGPTAAGAPPETPSGQRPPDGGGSFRTPAPVVANPNPAAPPPVTTGGGLANIPTGQPQGPAQAPAMTAAAPGGTPTQSEAPAAPAPMPKEMEDMSREYEEKIQAPLRSAWARLQAQGKATPAAKAALMSIFREKNKDFETRFGSLVEKQKQAAVAKMADQFVDAVTRGDTATIERMYGKGAVPFRDKRTGLDGVKLPNGGPFVGVNTVVARGMLKAGLISPKDYAKAASDDAKDQARLLQEWEKMQMEVKIQGMKDSSDHNKEIEAAHEAQRLTNQLNDPKTPESAKPGIKAALDRINVPVTRANAYADYTHSQALARLDAQQQNEVNKAIAQAGGDMMKGTEAISPQQATARMLEFIRKDPTGAMATGYMTGLNPAQNAACMAKFAELAKKQTEFSLDKPENTQDAGSNKGGGGARKQFQDQKTGELVWFRLKGNEWVKE